MPATYSIDYARSHVDLLVEGDISMTDIQETLAGLANDPLLTDGFSVLADHRGISRPITPTQMSRLIGLLGQLFPRFDAVRWAIVVPSGPSYGMMRLLAANADLAANMQVRAFFDPDDAERWLAHGDE